MQVLHQNIGLDLYIFKTFFKIFFLFICLLKSFIYFLVEQQTPLREIMRTGKRFISLRCSESAIHHYVQQLCIF